MSKKTIASVDVSGKRVLIRVDFNVPIEGQVEGTGSARRITDDRRIREALPTIKSVIERGGRCILMSHLGRPEGTGYDAQASLDIVATRLSELLGRPVQFPSKDCCDNVSATAVSNLTNGEVLLLENVRFAAGEKKGAKDHCDRLASYADVYVNDAFGTSHRAEGSMVGVPMAMRAGAPRVMGFLVEKELKYLHGALEKPAKPFVVVLGGAKVSDKIPCITNLLPKADTIIVGGAMAYTFLSALGKRVGTSRVEADFVAKAKEIIEQAAKSTCELLLPVDHVCSTQFAADSGDIEVFDENIKDGFMGLDIGPKTQTKYALALRKAKTIVWNGPMGVFEWAPFATGTRTVARAMAEATKTGAITIVGGGDSAAAVEQFKFADDLSHVSTGGGASLELLEGKRFESVNLLENA